MSRADTASINVRHAQQHRVAELLDEIAARRQRLYVLKAYGVRRAGMRTLKAELTAVRDELAEVTSPAEANREVVPARRASVAAALAPVGASGVARRQVDKGFASGATARTG
jgi:hypothetical protein